MVSIDRNSLKYTSLSGFLAQRTLFFLTVILKFITLSSFHVGLYVKLNIFLHVNLNKLWRFPNNVNVLPEIQNSK